MIALKDKSKCTGCTACAAVCPLDCIAMVPDGEGFLYPEIDRARCVSCGKCETVCPAERPGGAAEPVPAAYALRARDLDLRLSSSSGGAFSLLAEEVLAGGGAVFGAAMARDCKSACHVMAETKEELAGLRGSKYLQSELGDAYRRVKEELSRRSVLFTGTPCQVDGLSAYLGRGYENLLTVEVICHGAPTAKLWRKYVEAWAARSDGEIVKAEFRHKKCGWRLFGSRLENSNRKVLYSTLRKDPYIQMFLRNLCLRPSCYQCPSKGLDRTADLTIGDFWGIETVVPELDDDKGTSLVLVHTEKGRAALERILPNTDWKQVNCAAALRGNPAMVRSVEQPGRRDAFMADMDRLSFQKLAEKYVPRSMRTRAMDLLEKMGLLPAVLRAVQKYRKKRAG